MKNDYCSSSLSGFASLRWSFSYVCVLVIAILTASQDANSSPSLSDLNERGDVLASENYNTVDHDGAEVGIAKRIYVAYLAPMEQRPGLEESWVNRDLDSEESMEVSAVATDETCTPTLSERVAFVDSRGGSVRIRVTAGKSCSWRSSASNIPWLVPEGSETHHGSDMTSYTVVANSEFTDRMAALTVGVKFLL